MTLIGIECIRKVRLHWGSALGALSHPSRSLLYIKHSTQCVILWVTIKCLLLFFLPLAMSCSEHILPCLVVVVFFTPLTYQRFNICVCSLWVAAWEGFGPLSESARARHSQQKEMKKNEKQKNPAETWRRKFKPKGIVRWKGKCVQLLLCAGCWHFVTSPAAVAGWEMKVLKTQEFNWSWRACTNSAFMPLCAHLMRRLCVGPTIMTFFSLALLFVLRSVEPWFFVDFPPIKPPLTYAL